MEKKTILQKLKKEDKDILSMAKRYYATLFAFNGIHMTERKLQLVAFTAVKGNISYSSYKEEFCSLFNSSFPTINNMISELKKENILKKESGKIKVNPVILLNFENNLILTLSLSTNG